MTDLRVILDDIASNLEEALKAWVHRETEDPGENDARFRARIFVEVGNLAHAYCIMGDLKLKLKADDCLMFIMAVMGRFYKKEIDRTELCMDILGEITRIQEILGEVCLDTDANSLEEM